MYYFHEHERQATASLHATTSSKVQYPQAKTRCPGQCRSPAVGSYRCATDVLLAKENFNVTKQIIWSVGAGSSKSRSVLRTRVGSGSWSARAQQGISCAQHGNISLLFLILLVKRWC